MSIKKITLLALIILSPMTYAFGRAPAVEPGVVIDAQFPVISPAQSPSLETVFNLQTLRTEAPVQAEEPWEAQTAMAYLLFVGIPLFWSLMIGRLALTYAKLEEKQNNVVPLPEKSKTKKVA